MTTEAGRIAEDGWCIEWRGRLAYRARCIGCRACVFYGKLRCPVIWHCLTDANDALSSDGWGYV